MLDEVEGDFVALIDEVEGDFVTLVDDVEAFWAFEELSKEGAATTAAPTPADPP